VSNLLKKDKGFTLIEVVLVMAIAGLILVIVFLAVQGAQRSRRDNARKHDAARMLAAVESCAGNQNGSYTSPVNCSGDNPLLTATTGTPYFSPNVNPDGTAYQIGTADNTHMQVQFNTACPSGGAVHPASVTVGQESGANYCVGN